MDQQQKRPREDAAPASAPKRKKHSFPLFLGGVQPYWYKDNRDRAEGAAAAYLRDRTNHDGVTVELDVPPTDGQTKGTAWFHGPGDAPLARHGRHQDRPAREPHEDRHVQEVKEHSGFADAGQGLMDEICAEAEAEPPPPRPRPRRPPRHRDRHRAAATRRPRP